MSANWVRVGAIAFLTMVPAAGWSQSAEPPAAASPESLSTPRQDAEAEKAMQRPSGKAGREEPSSHTPTVPPLESTVFVNGVLAVPGAPPTPIRYRPNSPLRTAPTIKLITLAYTFKTLPNDQRQAIYQALKEQPAAAHAPAAHAPNVHAQIGTVLPFAIVTKVIPAQLGREGAGREGVSLHGRRQSRAADRTRRAGRGRSVYRDRRRHLGHGQREAALSRRLHARVGYQFCLKPALRLFDEVAIRSFADRIRSG